MSKSVLSSIAGYVAYLGTNLTFVASVAHICFAFMLVTLMPSWWTIAAVAVVAGVKEFVFDASQEVPKQTFVDNGIDWTGYMVGAMLAAQHVGIWPWRFAL